MDIDQLLAQPESKTLEFKRDISSLDPILKTIVAFANTAGGILIIGRSADRVLIGVKDIFKAEETLANAIADNIRPSILPEIEIATVDGKDLLVVKVFYWRAPFYLKKEGVPRGVYIRLGSTSRPAGEELLAELQRSVLTSSFDQQALSDLSKTALDMAHAAHFFKKEINEEKLRSLGVLNFVAHRLVPSIGGLILFGREAERQKFTPDARVSCARFHGDTKTNIIDRYEVEGTILDAVKEVPKFIARNTRLTAQIQHMYRKDIPEYPIVAVREALINALAHADYSLSGAHIQIAIFSDRLEIQNPGMLPFGFTLEDLKTGVSRVRNRVIARIFHELQLMEEWGSGYKRIIEACREGGYPEPKWEEIGAVIRVTFYPHPQSLITEKQTLQPEMEMQGREKAILRLFKKSQSLPFRMIFEGLSPRISERMLRYDLARLKKQGQLISKGKGRATVYLRKSASR